MQTRRHCICWLIRSCLQSQLLETLRELLQELHWGTSCKAKQLGCCGECWQGGASRACMQKDNRNMQLCSRSGASQCTDLLCCSQSCPDSPGITCCHAAAGPGSGRTSASKRLLASLRLCRRLQAESCRLGSVPIIGFMWNGSSCWFLSVCMLSSHGTAITGTRLVQQEESTWISSTLD